MSQLAKTHILFPVPLLKEIDKTAGAGLRSQFVIEAAREKLARMRFSKSLEMAAGTWTFDRHPALKDQKGINRFLKNIRRSANNRLQRRLHG